jgi:hypothetical protein
MPDGPRPLTRLQLQDVWRRRVAEAREKYYTACATHLNALLKEQELVVWGSDGSHAVTLASREECTAYTEYVRALNILKDLVADNVSPEEQLAMNAAGIGRMRLVNVNGT